MPTYQETPTPVYPLLEDYTTLPAIVTEIEEKDTPFRDDDGNLQKTVSFTFRIPEGEHADRKFWGNSPTFWNNSDKCKLRQWAQSIANRAYAPGEPLNTDDLLNRPCRVVLTVKKKQNGEMTNRVIDVLPTKVELSAAPPAAAPTAAPPTPQPAYSGQTTYAGPTTTAYGADEPF